MKNCKTALHVTRVDGSAKRILQFCERGVQDPTWSWTEQQYQGFLNKEIRRRCMAARWLLFPRATNGRVRVWGGSAKAKRGRENFFPRRRRKWKRGASWLWSSSNRPPATGSGRPGVPRTISRPDMLAYRFFFLQSLIYTCSYCMHGTWSCGGCSSKVCPPETKEENENVWSNDNRPPSPRPQSLRRATCCSQMEFLAFFFSSAAEVASSAAAALHHPVAVLLLLLSLPLGINDYSNEERVERKGKERGGGGKDVTWELDDFFLPFPHHIRNAPSAAVATKGGGRVRSDTSSPSSSRTVRT